MKHYHYGFGKNCIVCGDTFLSDKPNKPLCDKIECILIKEKEEELRPHKEGRRPYTVEEAGHLRDRWIMSCYSVSVQGKIISIDNYYAYFFWKGVLVKKSFDELFTYYLFVTGSSREEDWIRSRIIGKWVETEF